MNSDPPRTVGLNDLGQLPLRANVAFAVRCAQRIRPCFRLPAGSPRRHEQTAAVDRAIRAAAAFCLGLPAEAGEAAASARAAAVVAEETSESTSFSGFGAVRAAEAAAYAEEWARNPSDSNLTEVVAAAFGAGRVLLANSDAFAHDLIVSALYEDVQNLLRLAGGSSEDVGPPIDPSESGPLGPLWPAGVPVWFREA
jgi:hypothetical protein